MFQVILTLQSDETLPLSDETFSLDEHPSHSDETLPLKDKSICLQWDLFRGIVY